MKSIDLTKEKVITLADLAAAAQADTTELLLAENAVMTPSALEFVDHHRLHHDVRLQAVRGSVGASLVAPTSRL